jgi:hypothetical protein
MKEITSFLNNDFFYMTKDWLSDVDQNMKIKKNGKLEVKYFDGVHYMTYPLDCTYEEAENDIQHVIKSCGIAIEDQNIYIIKKLNELIADSLEFAFDSSLKDHI